MFVTDRPLRSKGNSDVKMVEFNSEKDHISGKYKYVKNVEFIQLYEDGEVDFDGNKLTYKDGCWRLGMVQREILDNGGWGGGWGRELKTVLIPITPIIPINVNDGDYI